MKWTTFTRGWHWRSTDGDYVILREVRKSLGRPVTRFMVTCMRSYEVISHQKTLADAKAVADHHHPSQP